MNDRTPREARRTSAGVWLVVGCAALLAWALPATRGAAQATDGTDEGSTASDDTGDASETPEGGASDAASSEGAAALGTSSTALEPGDLEAEEAAASGEGEGGEAAAEEEQAAREPFPWRNSFFSWTHGVTPNSFFRDAQLSYNPNYYWAFNLAPRWYLDPQTFFFLSETLLYELTDDDSSQYNHDLQLSDLIVELRRTEAWEGFIFIPALRVILPASKSSQAAERYFGLAGGLTAVRVIPEAAGLTFAAIGRYQYWFAGRNVPVTMGRFPGDTTVITPGLPQQQAIDGVGSYADAPTIDQASGLTSARHQITAGLTINLSPFSGFTISAAAFWLSQEGHGLGAACYHAATSAEPDCLPDNSATHWRHFTSLSLTLAYDVQTWLNLSVGWSNSYSLAPFFAQDGSVLGPFNPDNNFFLTATVQIDALYEAIAGGEDDGLTPEQRQRRRQGLAGNGRGTIGGSF